MNLETFCGLDEKEYKPLFVFTYLFEGHRVEFIVVPELIEYFEDFLTAQENYLQTLEVFGVSVKALKRFDFIDSLNLEDTYKIFSSDNRKTLREAAYLKHIKAELNCLIEGRWSLNYEE
ncbi:hypothetical protein [Pseudanabaena sp. FACHB-2040]|uniref:hypothetical protein n=1 Tax=Pseudanabaena sp. FACHB-2040 TaxID=2692859 RepID=UPI001686AA7E|nr:hypothetical protein [Pseudanabaena sp. FACHB-2040]MBD2256838.1 hypothetical protein [Pseudanabaena sp. FACHB-2040]